MTGFQSAPLGRVRSTIERALGDDRLSGISERQPLLRSGVLTSIELIHVVAALEREFDCAIPAMALDASISLEGLATLALPAGSPTATAPERLGSLGPLQRVARRPVLLVFALVGWLAVLDLGLAMLVRGPLSDAYQSFSEHGRRLFPYSGAFSHDDFSFAVAQHEINRMTERDQPWVVLGDSGTYGLFLRAEEAMPARLEHAFRDAGQASRVANLAWFGRSLVKDYMFLELAWDAPLRGVVFTLHDDLFRRRIVDRWIRDFRHISVNAELLARFARRVPASEAAPFAELLQQLRAADRQRYGWLRRIGYRTTAVSHYGPFLRYLVTTRLLPAGFGSEGRAHASLEREGRSLLGMDPDPAACGLRPDEIDPRQLAMLRSAIRLLRERRVMVVLYVPPCAPLEWRPAMEARELSSSALAEPIAAETGAIVVDQTWALAAADFLDIAHYTPRANERLAAAIAAGLGMDR